MATRWQCLALVLSALMLTPACSGPAPAQNQDSALIDSVLRNDWKAVVADMEVAQVPCVSEPNESTQFDDFIKPGCVEGQPEGSAVSVVRVAGIAGCRPVWLRPAHLLEIFGWTAERRFLGILDSVPFPRSEADRHLVFTREVQPPPPSSEHSGFWLSMRDEKIVAITSACGTLETQLGEDFESKLAR